MPITIQGGGTSSGGGLELHITTEPNTDVRLLATPSAGFTYDKTVTSDDDGIAVFKGLKGAYYRVEATLSSAKVYRKYFTLVDQYDGRLKPTVKYSGTPNIDLATGTANTTYGNSLERNDVVTIPGAHTLEIEVWCSTENVSYDWLAIYQAGITPSSSNYSSARISGGKLGGQSNSGSSSSSKPSSSKKFTVSGDTAQFYFKSDGSVGNYGYYAVITGYDNSTDIPEMEPV